MSNRSTYNKTIEKNINYYKSEEEKEKQQQELMNYQILKTIGYGTFSIVKLGIHKPTNEYVAIKIIDKSRITDKDELTRIKREISFLKILNHPNVIKTFDIIENDIKYYIIMEYASGGELYKHITDKQRLPEEEAAFIFCQLICGIEYIHKKGISHRDIKPENILLKNNKLIAITDFGLSNKITKNKLLKSCCGSPNYVAPEILTGEPYNGIKIDIWSSGISLYAMVCGCLPFENESDILLYEQIKSGKFYFKYTLSENCKDLITKLLDVNQEKRINIKEIKEHPFLVNYFNKYNPENYLIFDSKKIDNSIINLMIYNPKFKAYNFTKNKIIESIKYNILNNTLTTYTLLMSQKKRRITNYSRKKKYNSFMLNHSLKSVNVSGDSNKYNKYVLINVNNNLIYPYKKITCLKKSSEITLFNDESEKNILIKNYLKIQPTQTNIKNKKINTNPQTNLIRVSNTERLYKNKIIDQSNFSRENIRSFSNNKRYCITRNSPQHCITFNVEKYNANKRYNSVENNLSLNSANNSSIRGMRFIPNNIINLEEVEKSFLKTTKIDNNNNNCNNKYIKIKDKLDQKRFNTNFKEYSSNKKILNIKKNNNSQFITENKNQNNLLRKSGIYGYSKVHPKNITNDTLVAKNRKIKEKSIRNVIYCNNNKNQKHNIIRNLKISLKNNSHIDNLKQISILNDNNKSLLPKKIPHLFQNDKSQRYSSTNYKKVSINDNNNFSNSITANSFINNNLSLYNLRTERVKNGSNLINQPNKFYTKRGAKTIFFTDSNQMNNRCNNKYNCQKTDITKQEKIHKKENEICFNCDIKNNNMKNRTLNKNKLGYPNFHSELNLFSSMAKNSKNYKARKNTHECQTSFSADKNESKTYNKTDSFQNNFCAPRNSKSGFAIFNSYYSKEEIGAKLLRLCNNNHLYLKKLNSFNYICSDTNNNSIKIELEPKGKHYLVNIYDLMGVENINREIIKKVMVAVCF